MIVAMLLHGLFIQVLIRLLGRISGRCVGSDAEVGKALVEDCADQVVKVHLKGFKKRGGRDRSHLVFKGPLFQPGSRRVAETVGVSSFGRFALVLND